MSQILSPALVSELNKIASNAPGLGFGDVLETLLEGLEPAAGFVIANAVITAATKTKVSYDAKGLVTAGADATTADIADSSDKRYCTNAQKALIALLGGVKTPSGKTDTGVAGTIAWDSDYIYICIATNSWKRVAILDDWGA